MRYIFFLVCLALVASCGEKSADNNGACTSGCTNNETTGTNDDPNNDPTCETPCPAGEYQEFGECDDDTCTPRIACGEEITCRDQAACLAEASCQDGGLLLDSCPPDEQNCLPFEVCGLTKYCIALQQCAREACDAGESATTLGCDDPAIALPCREVTACGADSVTCVCRAEDLFCEDDEEFDTDPCQSGRMCREVEGCGTTFYCKGESI